MAALGFIVDKAGATAILIRIFFHPGTGREAATDFVGGKNLLEIFVEIVGVVCRQKVSCLVNVLCIGSGLDEVGQGKVRATRCFLIQGIHLAPRRLPEFIFDSDLGDAQQLESAEEVKLTLGLQKGGALGQAEGIRGQICGAGERGVATIACGAIAWQPVQAAEGFFADILCFAGLPLVAAPIVVVEVADPVFAATGSLRGFGEGVELVYPGAEKISLGETAADPIAGIFAGADQRGVVGDVQIGDGGVAGVALGIVQIDSRSGNVYVVEFGNVRIVGGVMALIDEGADGDLFSRLPATAVVFGSIFRIV